MTKLPQHPNYAKLSSGAGGWPAPQPLTTSLPPVEKFDLEMLPPVLREWGEDVADLMQVPIDFVAVCIMLLLAGATNRRVRIQPKQIDSTWRETLNLWGAIVAPPGDKKTSVVQRIFKPLYRAQQRLREEDGMRLSGGFVKRPSAPIAIAKT